jgi:hypothetical protein
MKKLLLLALFALCGLALVPGLAQASNGDHNGWVFTPMEHWKVSDNLTTNALTLETPASTTPDVWFGTPTTAAAKLSIRSVSLANRTLSAQYSRDNRQTWQDYTLSFDSINRANVNQVGNFVDSLAQQTGNYIGFARYAADSYRLVISREPIPADFWDDSGCGLACA